MAMRRLLSLAGCGLLLAAAPASGAGNLPPLVFEQQQDHLVIRFGERPLATYVLRDDAIPRPYFAHVHAPNAVRVTRNHPPLAGRDATDHATFHPGIWLAFGDLAGHDNWRLKARVVHDGFVQPPQGKPGWGSFAVRNRYLAQAGQQTICSEICRYTIWAQPRGYLLVWDSTFSSDEADFYFGDQEEMGLGVRVATPLAVKTGGRLLNSDGLRNEAQAWGRQADWCDYSGLVDGQRVGVMIMPAPHNFRRCWFHARDYGFVAANPFGVNAFTRGPKSKVVVARGESLRLRFGLWIYAVQDDDPQHYQAAYRDFLSQLEQAAGASP